ncbi:MAG: OmpA family protein [Prevotellaceae bacterium]|jgi:outer membrane protein OmpA-like peptidoglycan-associated protein|nr:OmpA family protein [Prevotellaceae bacterium]
MKRTNLFITLILSMVIVLSGCSSLNSTAKGALFGTGGGAALGAALGGLIGKDGKSAAIGAAIGGAVGATAGTIIGKKMDKAAEQAAAIDGAKVEGFTDNNGLQAVRVTFDSGILFATGKSDLNTASRTSLTKFAKILVENPTMEISILGHTDNTGSLATNQRLSLERANSVSKFLTSNGVTGMQVKSVEGKDYQMPVASNETVAGRAENRRVEIYMYASEQMIKEAESQTNY